MGSYMNVVTITIIATDSSGGKDREARDTFEICVDPTLSYLFNLTIKFGSIAIAAFGIIKYFDEIYEIFCKESYQHKRRDKVKTGE